MANSNTQGQRLVFLGGVIGGLALAALSALTGGANPDRPLPPDAIARVGTNIILRDDFTRALIETQLNKARITPEDEAAILQQLIDEELLAQRALDLGLALLDPDARRALATATINDVRTRHHSKPISAMRVRDFYFQNKARFTRPERVLVRPVFFPTSTASKNMKAFDQDLLAGTTAEALLQRFGGETPPVPAVLSTRAELQPYLSQQLLSQLDTQYTRQWSDWISDEKGFWRLYLANRTRARTPALENIQQQVEAAYLAERDNKDMTDYIALLRQDGDIELSADAPQ